MSGKVVFITGGARSGKSGFALASASNIDGSKCFIATATAVDEEMAERIARHRADRSSEWKTIEEPISLAKSLEDAAAAFDIIVIDCLTVWLSNSIWAKLDAEDEVEKLLAACERVRDRRRVSLFVVSNEVGMGIVPEHAVARRFRDLAGMLNRKIAAASDEAFLVTAGIPLKLKGEGAR